MKPRSKPKTNRNRQAVPTEAPAPRLGALLEIPSSSLGGIPQMEIAGNREAVIDGCQGILEYDENVVKLTTGKMSIRFFGRGLQIKVLTHDSAVVTGFITNIDFIT